MLKSKRTISRRCVSTPGRRHELEHDKAAASIYAGRLSVSQMEPEDLFLLGLLNARAGRFESALELWAEAAREGNDEAELLDNLARMSVEMQRLDEAADAARRLSPECRRGRPAECCLLGDILALLDDPKGSVDAFRDALERDPNRVGAPLPLSHYRKRLARGLLQLGQPAEARAGD